MAFCGVRNEVASSIWLFKEKLYNASIHSFLLNWPLSREPLFICISTSFFIAVVLFTWRRAKYKPDVSDSSHTQWSLLSQKMIGIASNFPDAFMDPNNDPQHVKVVQQSHVQSAHPRPCDVERVSAHGLSETCVCVRACAEWSHTLILCFFCSALYQRLREAFLGSMLHFGDTLSVTGHAHRVFTGLSSGERRRCDGTHSALASIA